MPDTQAAGSPVYFACNFIKIHRSLRVTPAMEAKIVNRPFDLSDLVNPLIEAESKKAASRVSVLILSQAHSQ